MMEDGERAEDAAICGGKMDGCIMRGWETEGSAVSSSKAEEGLAVSHKDDGRLSLQETRAQLRADIAAFSPFNEQETADKRVILQALDDVPGCFERSAQAHMACSIWVVDPTRTQTLLVYHNIYDSWSWIGGHADGECDLAAVALRELGEETGVEHARLVPCGPGGIYSLEVLTVNGHEKRGAYVSSHLHLNVTYLAIADPTEHIRIKPDENSGVRWVPLEDAIRLSTEPWIRERVYRKLIDKMAQVPDDMWRLA